MSDVPPPPPASPSSPTLRAFARVSAALLVALAFAAVAFVVFTRHNDFPVSYHPDEQSKVEQLDSPDHERNLKHPLLLVETADLAWRAAGVAPGDERGIAIAGRTASAALASVGVFAVTVAGFIGYGWPGLLIVGTAAALCPPLCVHAHYLKEDAALICGIATTLLGARLVLSTRRPIAQVPASVALGVGCALAASGKFVGAAALAPALLALSIAPLSRWWLAPLRIVVFAIAAVVVAVAVNARAFDDPWRLKISDRWHERFDAEVQHATTEHSGLALTTPNAFCVRVAAGELMPHAYALAAFGAITLAAVAIRRCRWPISRWGIVFAAFPITFASVLSRNVIPIERYALPLSVFGFVGAATLAAAAIDTLRSPRAAAIATGVVVLLIAIAQGDRCRRFDRQFADDSRQRLREWLAKNVEPGAPVVADFYADLYGPGDRWRFPNQSTPRLNVWPTGFAAGGGSLARLADGGVRYVIVVDSTYRRFFIPEVRGVDADNAARLARSQAFYRDLFARGRLVWSSAPRPASNSYVDAEIRVYRIDALATPPTPPAPPRTAVERWMRTMATRPVAPAENLQR